MTHKADNTRDDAGAGGAAAPVIVVGVEPGQHDVVLDRAADLAARMHARLLCAYADPASYPADPTETAEMVPIDPDGVDPGRARVRQELLDWLGERLGSQATGWEFRLVAGEADMALAELAVRHRALMIVVGARHRGVGGRLEDLMTGSIAVRLTRRQDCPVLVVPVHPA